MTGFLRFVYTVLASDVVRQVMSVSWGESRPMVVEFTVREKARLAHALWYAVSRPALLPSGVPAHVRF